MSLVFGRGIGGLTDDVLGDAELVTFDVFDTLVRRSCGDPGSVFDLVERIAREEAPELCPTGFRHMREAAECEARHAVGSGEEVTLAKIYERLPLLAGVCEELMELELACELAVCEPNPKVVSRYDEIRASRRVAIVSDMYLPEWAVAAILDECGVYGYEELFVSSRHGAMKRNGRLFKLVIDELRVDPNDALHVGDHPLADWIAPQRLGMGAYLLSN